MRTSIYKASSPVFALFTHTVADQASERLAWSCWERLCGALKVSGSPDSGDVAEIAYHLGRCWLQVLWSDYTVLGLRKRGLLDDVEMIDQLQAYSEAQFNMNAGYIALQTWTGKRQAQFETGTAKGKQQSFFENEYRAVLKEASHLGEYIDRHVALQSLAASKLSILESRRAIEVSERAMEVTERAERQARDWSTDTTCIRLSSVDICDGSLWHEYQAFQ